VRSVRISRKIWIPAAETAIFVALLYEHLNAGSDRDIFDYGIEALVYVMPLAILYGIIKRRLAAKWEPGDQ
jgi:hypothetical protein